MPASAGDSKAPRLQEAGYRSDAANRPLDLPVHGYRTEVTHTLFGDSGATRRRGVRCMLPKSRRASIVWIQTLSSTVVLKDCHGVFELMLRNCHFDISDSAGVERIHPAQFGVQETGFQTTTFEEPNHQLCFHPVCSQENDLHP